MAERSLEELRAAKTRSARLRRLRPVAALVVAGAVLLIIDAHDLVLTAIATMLLGSAAVWVIALAFYEIGTGEELDRAEQAQRRGGR